MQQFHLKWCEWKGILCTTRKVKVKEPCLSFLQWNILHDDIADRECSLDLENIAFANDPTEIGKGDNRGKLAWNMNRMRMAQRRIWRDKNWGRRWRRLRLCFLSRPSEDRTVCKRVWDTLVYLIPAVKTSESMTGWETYFTFEKHLRKNQYERKKKKKKATTSQPILSLISKKRGPTLSRRRYYFNVFRWFSMPSLCEAECLRKRKWGNKSVLRLLKL